MPVTVLDSQIVVNLDCPVCGHQWDVERTEASVYEAELNATDEECPKCKELAE